MDFSEKTKRKVKEKAAFRCCRCQEIGVHVHHMLPKEHGGKNDIDNAAPLCPSCHDYFGDNHKKRKEIKQMRDWWYGQVERQHPNDRQMVTLQEINDRVEELQKKQISLDEFKVELGKFARDAVVNITAGTAVSTASGIANASTSPSPLSYEPFPSSEKIEAAGDRWIQEQIDIERGK